MSSILLCFYPLHFFPKLITPWGYSFFCCIRRRRSLYHGSYYILICCYPIRGRLKRSSIPPLKFNRSSSFVISTRNLYIRNKSFIPIFSNLSLVRSRFSIPHLTCSPDIGLFPYFSVALFIASTVIIPIRTPVLYNC